MKKLFFVLMAALLITASCKDSQTAGYKISGKITNAGGKDLVLSKLGMRSLVAVDTVKMDKDGSFTFAGTTSAPEFFAVTILDSIQTGRQEYITLVVDSLSQITLNSDTADFSTKYTVSGSTDSQLLKDLNDQLEKSLAKVDSLGEIYRAAEGEENGDSIKASVDDAFVKLLEEQKTFNKNFIDANPKSLASLIALSQAIAPRTPVLNMQDDKAYFDKVDTELFGLYPKSEAVKSLHEYLVKVNEEVTDTPATDAGTGIEIGSEAKEIALSSPEGKVIKLSSLRGNYVLLDFWAGWCKPCRMESPTLVSNFAKYKAKGFTIYQVSLDQTKESWVEAIKNDKLGAWNHVSDLLFWSSAPAQEYGIRSIPANFLLDPTGKIVARDLRGPALGAKLKEVYGF